MRRFAVVVFALMLLTQITGRAAGMSLCDRLEIFGTSFTSSKVTQDLISGSWDVHVTGAYGTMYFHNDGTADHINSYLEGRQIETFSWLIEVNKDDIHVSLNYPDGKTEIFYLTPTCDGYAVKNVNGKNGTMSKTSRGSEKILQQSRWELIGEWQTASSEKRHPHQAMVWNFDKNGRFRLSMAPDYTHSVMQGVWDLTPDGDHIMLFFTALDNVETVYAREILNIRGLDFEDMVLSGDTFERLVQKKSSHSAMYFEKIPGI